MSSLVKLGLLENTSIISFDARINPGYNEKLQKQLSLAMLKNIEKMRAKGLAIKKEWLNPDLYSQQIPPAILKSLSLKAPGEKTTPLRRASTRLIRRDPSDLDGLNSDFS